MAISSLNAQYNSPYGLNVATGGNMSSTGNGRQFMQPVVIDTSKNAATAAATVSPVAGLLGPKISDAVQRVLLTIQETGSAMTGEERQRATARGVSDEDQSRYAAIVQQAATSGGYEKPVEFIHSLSQADQHVLRRIHGLAELSGVTDTDEEGALNLLLNHAEHVDTNNDGLVNVGKAKIFAFPPPNSPQNVKDAWAEATKDMDPRERLMSVAPFMALSVAANIRTNEKGEAIGMYEPGEEGYTNIFGTTQKEWDDLLARMLEMLDAAKDKMPQEQYEKQHALLSDFYTAMIS